MLRYIIEKENIIIIYGFNDELKGLFLYVCDKNLEWNENNTEEINNLCDNLSLDGAGCYLNMNTYKTENEDRKYKVDINTIINFMEKYKIKKKHLLELVKYFDDNIKI